MVPNPFDSLIQQSCTTPEKFESNKQQCFYGQNAGQLIFVAVCLIALKAVLKAIVLIFKPAKDSMMTKIDSFVGIDMAASLIDAVQFDILLAAALNLSVYS